MAASYLSLPKARIEFDLEFPTGISISKSSGVKAGATPPGSVHPFYVIAEGSASMHVDLTFRVSHLERGSIMDVVKAVRRAVYPSNTTKGASGESSMPARATLVLEKYITIEGYLQSYGESVPDEGGWINGEPNVVDIKISLIEANPGGDNYTIQSGIC